jgi:hypothetical protein
VTGKPRALIKVPERNRYENTGQPRSEPDLSNFQLRPILNPVTDHRAVCGMCGCLVTCTCPARSSISAFQEVY